MKRIVSLILVSLLTLSAFFCLAGCGAVNEGKVVVLWKDENKATNPNSLINCMDRAMYIENIECTYFGANGVAAKQLEQAQSAIAEGCQVLVVELIDAGNAQAIVDAAKEKNIPVVFFNCDVDVSTLNYENCYVINSNTDTIAEVQGKLIADYVKANYKDIDNNKDKQITAINKGETIGENAIKKANELLATDDYKVSDSLFGEKYSLSVVATDDTVLTNAELIVTNEDDVAFEVLKQLQSEDYNTDKLAEKFVPIVTVNADKDYKAYVVSGRPEIPAEDRINEGDDQKTIDAKNEKIKNNKELQEHYEKNKYLVDLTAVRETELQEMIYTTLNVIDSGRLAGSAITDQDGISAAVATIVKNLCQGNDFAKGLVAEPKEGEEPSIVVDGRIVKVRYIAYGI